MKKNLPRNFVLFTCMPAAFWKAIIFLSNAECHLNCNIANSQLSRWWRKILMQMVWACHEPAQHGLLDWHVNWDSNSKYELKAVKNGCLVHKGPGALQESWDPSEELWQPGWALGTCLRDISKGFLGEIVIRRFGTSYGQHRSETLNQGCSTCDDGGEPDLS